MEALTPNTAAFLDSLSFDAIKPESDIVSMPPSTFFPIPGRDTPEDSSPDSQPAKHADTSRVNLSDDSDADFGPGASHKRKASVGNVEHDEDDGDDSLSDNAHHDDKRQHPNTKKDTSRRKSNENKNAKGTKDTATTKAQRRKEQNRAAQKAFRERREAKVRDLEQKVAELEAKSFGASVENENLRNILKRLQEENVALKQATFTFSMPVNGQPNAGVPGQQTPTPATSVNGTAVNGAPSASGIDWSQFSTFKKPPSPAHSVSNDSLRSINDASPQLASHRNSNSGASPESLLSIGAGATPGRSPNLFGANGNGGTQTVAQTAYQEALKRQNSISASPNDQLSTPQSVAGTSKDDVEALFRSLYPNGIDSVLANMSNATGISPTATNLPNMTTQMPQYTFLGQSPGLTSQADTSSNSLAKLFGDATSYRDPSGTTTAANQTTAAAPVSSLSSDAAQAPWAGLTDNSVTEFLNSLNGNDKSMDANDLAGGADDEAFSRQLEALIAQSGGVSPESAFNLAPSNAFSPTNYLNMSPSPLNSLSNSQSPRSGTDATSPQSDIKSPASSADNSCNSGSKVIHVLAEDGRVMRPSEVWTRMGMHDSDPQDLLIDDLCDQMKSKATCKDGRRYMKYDDVEGMMRRRATGEDCDDEPVEQQQQQPAQPPAPVDPALDPELVCTKNDQGEFDPIACQAKLNEAFLKQNGLAV